MIGISLASSETPLSPKIRVSLTQLGVQTVRFKLPVFDTLRTSEIIASLPDAPVTLVAVLDFPPQKAADVLTPIRTLVQFWKGRIQHWEICSAPDEAASGWYDDQFVRYAICLKAVSEAIHTEDPSARVLNGGLGQSLPKGIARLHELNANASVDIWSVHPYINPFMPDAVGSLRYFHNMIQKTIAEIGDAHKPLWWTSISCPGMQDQSAAKNWWLGKNPNESVQADWLKTVLATVPTWGVNAVFWQDLMDHPEVSGDGRDYFGLIKADGTLKASATMFRDIALAPAS